MIYSAGLAAGMFAQRQLTIGSNDVGVGHYIAKAYT